MKIFEILLLSIGTILLFYVSIKKFKHNRKTVITTLIVLLLLHLILEGYRWQMITVYIITLIVFWFVYKKKTLFKSSWLFNVFVGLVLVITLGIGWILPNIFPVFNLPNPTGIYSVGSRYLHLKTSNKEIITPAINDKRELMLKVWYPAKLVNEKTESYLNTGDREGFAVKYGLPKPTFNYLDHIKTHTYKKPAIADGKFPVLIFSHGYNSKASGYYALMEEIVSHGYIVFNINHTYESVGSLFPSGEVKLYNKEYDSKNNHGDMVWHAMQNYDKAKTEEEKFVAAEDLIRNYFGAKITERWSTDISMVIDELDIWNSTTFMANHMDLKKIGVFGHSQGGSAAAEALIDDKRIKAGINIDGMQWGKMIDTMLTKPFALISSEWDNNHPKFNKYAYHNGSTSSFYNAKILGSGHSSFTDIPLMINLNLVNQAGTINPELSYEITSLIVLQFFNNYLLGKTSNLLELKSQYQELDIKMMTK